MNWDEYFMRMVYLSSSKSKDPSTQIGAVNVINEQVLSTGYNGICRNVADHIPIRLTAPEKYYWFEHAERNSCYLAARKGIRLEGATMYTQDIPCADCCRAVVQSGIKELVIHKQWHDLWNKIQGNNWHESQDRSCQMLAEAGIPIIMFDKELSIYTLIKGKKQLV